MVQSLFRETLSGVNGVKANLSQVGSGGHTDLRSCGNRGSLPSSRRQGSSHLSGRSGHSHGPVHRHPLILALTMPCPDCVRLPCNDSVMLFLQQTQYDSV